jgi:hypothetical protein
LRVSNKAKPLRLTRRALSFMAGCAGIAAGAPLPVGMAADAATGTDSDMVRTFSAFLDTLIPADDHGPAATSIGVDSRILAWVMRSGQDVLWLRFMANGCAWLDTQARSAIGDGFADASEAARAAIVERMAVSEKNTIERAFFDTWRRHAMRLYYANPTSWERLPISTPPQPVGYPDYSGPPQAHD